MNTIVFDLGGVIIDLNVPRCVANFKRLMGEDNVRNILGIDDEPRYKRNRIINQLEQTQMVALMAQYLDVRTMLEHLPWLTVDEVTNIITRLDAEADERTPADDDETTPPDDDAQEA